jgi:hypothetical protein
MSLSTIRTPLSLSHGPIILIKHLPDATDQAIRDPLGVDLELSFAYGLPDFGDLL